MVAKDTFFYIKKTLNCRGRILDLSTPKVMGILNITPDSFYDGGKYSTESEIIAHIGKMLEEGCDIIDIGASSTRPGATEISLEEELNRLIPVVKMVRLNFPESIISVDTYRSKVVEMAVEEGADIVNDVSAGSIDNEMFATVGRLKVPYVLMHMQGVPSTMQEDPVYSDVTEEVISFLAQKIDALKKAGVIDIIIDPGFGFGKTLEHNFQLLNELKDFRILECPVLVGMSRKSMINKVLKTKPEDALNGTTVANTIALMKEAAILRVHDVKEAAEAIKLVTFNKK